MGINLDHFGFLAPFYERFIKPSPPERLMGLMDFQEDCILLDAGGGTGRVSQLFVRDCQNVVVLDSSCKMLLEAQKKGILKQVCSETERLPFAPGTFDRIIIVDALHHVRNQSQTVSELIEALKPGGRLVIEEPDISKFAVKLIALAEKLFMMRSHFLSAGEVCDLCTQPEVDTRVESLNTTFWVVVEKKLYQKN